MIGSLRPIRGEQNGLSGRSTSGFSAILHPDAFLKTVARLLD